MRGVTEEKRLTSICSCSGMSAFMRFRSRKKKSTAPPKVSTALVTMTSLVWSSQRRKRSPLRLRSSQTRKPMPPIVISAMMVPQTSQSSEYAVREA